jgi:hypothetical protein
VPIIVYTYQHSRDEQVSIYFALLPLSFASVSFMSNLLIALSLDELNLCSSGSFIINIIVVVVVVVVSR